MTGARLRELQNELPMPLAQLLRRALRAEPGAERHLAAFYLAEASLKLAATLRIGRWLDHGAPDADLAKRLEALVLPSLGHWCGFLRQVAEALEDDPAAAVRGELDRAPSAWAGVRAFADAALAAGVVQRQMAQRAHKAGPLGFFDVLVTYRNEVLGHGAQRNARFYEELGALLLDATADVLAHEALFGGLRLAVARMSLSADKKRSTMGWVELTGLGSFPLRERAADGARPGALYFLGDDLRVPLHPLVVVEDDDDGHERFGFLNKAIVKRSGEEVKRVDFLDYASGQALHGVGAEAELRELLGQLRGASVDADAVARTIAALAAEDETPPPAARAEAASQGQHAPGVRFTHFRIERLLGEGCMGEVYLARDEKLERDVALKLLPARVVGSEERKRRFLREARSAAAIRHPNVAVIYETGEDHGTVFIAMEYLEGQSLRARLGDGALPPREALEVARGIAAAIQAAHAAGVIHRDLKPDNVMFDRDGRLRVRDFGLAKLTEQPADAHADTVAPETATLLTEEGRVMGTPGYMAPEQASGEPVDHRADIFALGVILYEMLTGARPFAGSSPLEVIASTLRDTPQPPSSRRHELGPVLDVVVSRCLAKRAYERFASAAELDEALADAMRGLEVAPQAEAGAVAAPARPAPDAPEPRAAEAVPPAADTLRSPSAGKARRRFIAAAIGLMLVAAAGLLWLRDRRGSESTAAAEGAATPADSCPPVSDDADIQREFCRGVEAYLALDIAAAETSFGAAAQRAPDQPWPHVGLSLVYGMKMHFAKSSAEMRLAADRADRGGARDAALVRLLDRIRRGLGADHRSRMEGLFRRTPALFPRAPARRLHAHVPRRPGGAPRARR
jgi:serine/threonine protein kinase